MGKRKAEKELTRFVWKRNPQFDIELLTHVEAYNPFVFSNQKIMWHEVSHTLIEGPLKMNVSARSCRERVAELLKNHRKGELVSSRA